MLVALADPVLGAGTAIHAAWQLTSPEAQLFRQEAWEDWAGDKAYVELEAVVDVDDPLEAALAKAKSPAQTTAAEKCMLSGGIKGGCGVGVAWRGGTRDVGVEVDCCEG